MTTQDLVDVMAAYEAEMSERIEPDRCDSCNARGFTVMTKGNYQLRFCDHHATKNSKYLIPFGWTATREKS